MRSGLLVLFALEALMVWSGAASAKERSRVESAPVAVTPERAALLAAKPTIVAMRQTEIGWIKGCAEAARQADCSVSGGFSLKPKTAPALQLTLGTESEDGTRPLSVLLPLDVELRAGFTVALDDGRAVLGTYASCSTIGCSGQVGLSHAEYEQFLRGRQVGLLIGNGGDKPLRLDIPLSGLTAAIDGPAMAPAEMVRRHDAAVETWKATAEAAKQLSAKETAAKP